MIIKVETKTIKTINNIAHQSELTTEIGLTLPEHSNESVSAVIDDHLKKHYDYHKSALHLKDIPQ